MLPGLKGAGLASSPAFMPQQHQKQQLEKQQQLFQQPQKQ
jgi:hypothetical protein